MQLLLFSLRVVDNISVITESVVTSLEFFHQQTNIKFVRRGEKINPQQANKKKSHIEI